ncbi:hypothetical protein DFJ58DRAFT_713607 [Suillus subalutaceus]|uniref:uncharacterized protein n=1 Tax=Suillus subalutaceus TaxID=48586 RepID=UPI001B85D1F6|nr:uncharacterized protein DFJ58DRAFT_713607 [Suillus subalutaceus]KAG1872304.1 hypothetical protein DFJ58DRAFT_713607 [Suillus subalutaceus]
MAYQYSGTGQQSVAELQSLTTFIGDPLFNHSDAISFSHTWDQRTLTLICRSYLKRVKSRAPRLRPQNSKYLESLITDIIESIFKDDIATSFNMTPYHEFWKSPNGHSIEVFSEAYSSPKMIETYAKINDLPREAGDNLERVVTSLMMWPDATHLVSFGNISVWPFYHYFGNQSKYTQGKPTASVCHHVTYSHSKK